MLKEEPYMLTKCLKSNKQRQQPKLKINGITDLIIMDAATVKMIQIVVIMIINRTMNVKMMSQNSRISSTNFPSKSSISNQ